MERRERLEREIAWLQKQLDACFEKRLVTDDPEAELNLEEREDRLEERIQKKRRELNELSDTSVSRSQKALDLEKGLCSVDFDRAKALVRALVKDLDRCEGGSALLLLEQCLEMEGNLLLRSLRDDLGAGVGRLQEFPMEFPPTMPADELTFLRILGRYFDLNHEESSTDRAQYVSKAADGVVKEIAGLLRSGTTVLISLRNWRKIGVDAQADFLEWFVETFWRKLVNAVTEVMRDYSPKVFFVIVVDEEMSEACQASGHFCEGEELDAYKIVRLPLSYWTQDDIRRWLDSYSVKLKKPERNELVSYIFGEKSEDAPLKVRRMLEDAYAKAIF